MARNTPLSNVVSMLKAELAMNMIVGVAVANDLNLASLIASKQRWLADIYDWPFLRDDWDIPIGSNQRYANMPINLIDTEGNPASTLNTERPFQVKCFFSGNWQDVVYGIDEQEFNYINSDGNPPFTAAPQQLDPIQRWAYSQETQFEVWPIPATSTIIRFRGIRTLTSLLSFIQGDAQPAQVQPNWSATLDLDDNMVMLFVAGEELQRLGKGNAQSVMQRAQTRMLQIRAQYPVRDMTCAFGQKYLRQYNRIIPVKKILVASG